MAPGAAFGGNGAGEDEDVIVEFTAGLGYTVGDAALTVHSEPTLHGRAVGTGPHSLRVGTAAEQQPQSGDHHGLSGTGLTGDNGKTR